jgi:hypothetical protein
MRSSFYGARLGLAESAYCHARNLCFPIVEGQLPPRLYFGPKVCRCWAYADSPVNTDTQYWAPDWETPEGKCCTQGCPVVTNVRWQRQEITRSIYGKQS